MVTTFSANAGVETAAPRMHAAITVEAKRPCFPISVPFSLGQLSCPGSFRHRQDYLTLTHLINRKFRSIYPVCERICCCSSSRRQLEGSDIVNSTCIRPICARGFFDNSELSMNSPAEEDHE